MSKNISHSKIYRYIIDVLEECPFVRDKLIENIISRVGLTQEELSDHSASGVYSNLRSRIGTIINTMHSKDLVSIDKKGRYYLVSDRPIVVRIEKCEKEILSLLTVNPLSKSELREKLKVRIGTDKTATTRDDDILLTYMGQILKRLVASGTLKLEDGLYCLSPKTSARADDLNAMLELKSDFILKIHTRGGEFFENFFVSLIKKHLIKSGKKVLDAYVVGGSSDGGIDGIVFTEDSLGFRETIMIQTKNRVDITSETDVRGFYGAVCAKKGSRGIFATTSDFHSSAVAFLDSLDDCVGINGEKLFRLAIETLYGIKKIGDKLEIDTKLFGEI